MSSDSRERWITAIVILKSHDLFLFPFDVGQFLLAYILICDLQSSKYLSILLKVWEVKGSQGGSEYGRDTLSKSIKALFLSFVNSLSHNYERHN